MGLGSVGSREGGDNSRIRFVLKGNEPNNVSESDERDERKNKSDV